MEKLEFIKKLLFTKFLTYFSNIETASQLDNLDCWREVSINYGKVVL